MGTKSVKVKTLAEKYGVSAKEIIKELESQGFDAPESASSVIPADLVDLIVSHFDELLAAKKKKGASSGTAGKSPVPKEKQQKLPLRRKLPSPPLSPSKIWRKLWGKSPIPLLPNL